MLTPIYRKKFEQDVKRLKKRGKNLKKLTTVAQKLIAETPLAKKHQEHSLKGEYSDCRECHIEPDWLLIYIIDNPHLTFVRSGTHSDLFR